MTALVSVFTAIVFAVLVGGGGSAAACTCAPLSQARALDAAASVFVADVVGIGDGNGPSSVVRYTLEVDRVHKGSAFEMQSLVTPADGDACGLSMELGEAWIVYATRPGAVGDERIDDTELAAGQCSGSRAVDSIEGADVVESLDNAEQPTPGASATSADGDVGIPGIVFGVAFAVLGLSIAAGGTLYVQRRRIRQ